MSTHETAQSSLSMHKTIKAIYTQSQEFTDKTLAVHAWIKSVRNQKTFSFIAVNDGTCLKNFQVIISEELTQNFKTLLEQLTVGAAIKAVGVIKNSPGKEQGVEMHASAITIVGTCPTSFPLQKKRHSFEFLRTIAHLRPRTNTGGAVARVRSKMAALTHQFFQEQGFVFLQSPIITGSDCEGAGEMLRVTQLDPAKKESQQPEDDFFKKPTFLTVSGQLNAEAYAQAFSSTYTFGPTFRAENSHTARHLAEFWMIEPEIAFSDLEMVYNLAEKFIKYQIKHVLETQAEDMEFFNNFIEKGLIERLQKVLSQDFKILSYTDAIDILLKADKKFTYPVKWGIDLQSEHERYLSESYANGPVILTNYPKGIKAFYMRDNDDNKTVGAFDIIVPKIGEIAGGSQREERLDVLKKKIVDNGLELSHYAWYLELREYGSTPHGGFGVGFERLVQFITGMENIRDIAAFPRSAGSCHY